MGLIKQPNVITGRIVDHCKASDLNNHKSFNKFASGTKYMVKKAEEEQDEKEIVKKEDIKGDQKEGYEKITEVDPEFVYVRVRAVTANIPNNNGDLFEREELLKTYKTFINQRVFKNHKSDDVTNAQGKIIDAIWVENPEDEDHPYVECLLEIDRKKDPDLVRGVEKGYITDVSMGCLIATSMVILEDYSSILIKDIHVGDKIITHTGKVVEVKNVQIREFDDDIYNIEVLGLNEELGITGEHPVWAINKEQISEVSDKDYKFDWVNTEYLMVGDYVAFPLSTENDNINLEDELKKYDRKFIYKNYLMSPITGISVKPYKGLVYNLETDDEDASYVANRIAVHNCRVEYSVCSCCGNKAHTEENYCDCVKKYKGQKFCPVHKKALKPHGIYEANFGVEFFELSFVTDGADRDAIIKEIVASSAMFGDINVKLGKVGQILVDSSNVMFQDCGIYFKRMASSDVISVKDMERIENVMNLIESFID